ncbi:natural cytotoxicity triggering receptor 2 isoform X1 [Loxodonta africana]|uniref:natural cytotoxicity triggering receptor 2 isoform X1 n=1 Tax=Loxodonta africana TaxID=9785 RepID=UPI000C811676|nr:trem-like transcript 4 protein [Loxodonta africana]
MALEPPYMLLVLLALVSGSWVQRLEAELQQGVAGETLTVTCWYLNKGGQYEAKVWCKANSDGCEYLIVISKPRTLVQDTQYMIWDDPDSGFLNITMNKLTEQDSGTYWCGIVNTSANSVTKIREISLEVSPERMLGSAPNNGSNDSNLMVILLSGFFTTKGLLLIALLVLLSYKVLSYSSSVGAAAMATPSPAKIPGPMGSSR